MSPPIEEKAFVNHDDSSRSLTNGSKDPAHDAADRVRSLI